MHNTAAIDLKKKMLFGAGLLALILVAIFIGINTTNRANANQTSNNVSTPEEMDMNINVKVGDGLVELNKSVNIAESDGTMSQDGTNATNPNVQVQVDGVPVTVPENGSVHKEINTENGSARIDISSESSNSSGDSQTRSRININSNSSSSVRIQE